MDEFAQIKHYEEFCKDKKWIGNSGICRKHLEIGEYFEIILSLLLLAPIWKCIVFMQVIVLCTYRTVMGKANQ